ncbi:universal stress protein UspA [Arthrobacter psychrolactophilus]|uniref:Universal stress protein UspA n=1 Tax=Arthrobacter psychrolactophilus TaxID=92442 RepID=A0A2V5IKC9_9MICC|nr:universal stress protein [Arthrobacter psychrolactophilus]PYI37119.1 universal stress protein UspA [Arthrobacter psychrolactophilus]
MSEEALKVRLVVGVDGSAASVNALREGARLAGELGGVVDAIAVWERPAKHASYEAAGIGNFEEGARQVLNDALSQAFGDDVPASLSARLLQGSPAAVLTEASVGARMLVVGQRGVGGLLGLILGSVSTAVIKAAPVPVLVVQ